MVIETETKEYLHYKNRFTGKRLFVCGNAPSIAEQYPLLRDEYSFAFNHFALWDAMPFEPSFYGIGDWDKIEGWDWENPYERLKWAGLLRPFDGRPKFYLRNKEDMVARTIDWTWVPAYPKVFRNGLMFTARFQPEPPFGAGASTPINLGVQLGAYMGFNPIYLLGVEFGSRNEAVWGDSEEGKRVLALKPNKPYNPAYLDGVTDAFHRLEARGIEFVNCTPGGRVRDETPLPYRDLKEVLAE